MTEIEQKIQMVKDVAEALKKVDRISVEDINYDVFTSKWGYREEYLVITYKGGAIAARNCAGDSCAAVFEEIAKLIYGGYYDEVRTYQELKAEAIK